MQIEGDILPACQSLSVPFKIPGRRAGPVSSVLSFSEVDTCFLSLEHDQ